MFLISYVLISPAQTFDFCPGSELLAVIKNVRFVHVQGYWHHLDSCYLTSALSDSLCWILDLGLGVCCQLGRWIFLPFLFSLL